jgi:hypothetical protein
MKLLYSAQRMADALGVKATFVYAVRRAGAKLKDPVPRYCGPEKVLEWLERHPDFVPNHWLVGPAKRQEIRRRLAAVQ